MYRKKNMKKAVILLGLLLSLVLTSCGPLTGPGRPPDSKYFQGREGVEIRLVENTPPYKVYYHPNDPDRRANTFPVTVEVANKGASFSYAGVYLSGFDPHMFTVNGHRVEPSGGYCDFSLSGLFKSFDDLLRGSVECFGFTFDWFGNGDWCAGMRGDNLPDSFPDWMRGFNVGYCSGQEDMLSIGLQDFDFEYAEHGRLLVYLFSGLRLDREAGVSKALFLQGDTPDFPGGELDYVEYDVEIVDWPYGLDETDQTFMVTSCYLYSTYADPLVCIDPQPYSMQNKVCSPGVHSWRSSQGAPVAVTRVEQENTPRKMIFKITVQNVGSGVVYDPGKLEKCDPYHSSRVTPSDLDIVYLGIVRIGSQRLECTPSEVIRLQGGTGTVTCTYDVEYANVGSAYRAPLVVELWYGYSDTVEKTVNIQRI
jgi:hypothetical protein